MRPTAQSRFGCVRFAAMAWAVCSLLAAEAQSQPRAKDEALLPNRVPKGVRADRDLSYVSGGHARQKLDLDIPEPADAPLPLVIWVHGGGWAVGSKDHCPPLRLGFAERNYAVASIGYRLSGNAVFPAQIEECKAAPLVARLSAKSRLLRVSGS